MLVHTELLGDWIANFAVDVPTVLAANIPVLVYSGTDDFICNYMGGRAWTNNMQWPGQKAFNTAKTSSWNFGGHQVGNIKSAQGFTWLEVFNAGHMVPMDQPAVALNMFNSFIFGKL
jgi:cathepsin A (carboxypeptidase C)